VPQYPYRCEDCETSWVELRPGSASGDPTTCPECGLEATQQDYSAKQVGGFVSSEGAWSSGKLITQLHPLHPDRYVTSKTQMEKVYRKHGISLDTGHYTSKEAQVKATVPRKQRLGANLDDLTVGGVIEEN